MRVLHIFDFDDTLVFSDSSIVINHGDGSRSVLSSDEYATYDEAPDDDLDFSDFDRYPENARIIGPVFAELLRAISVDGKESVVILTARENPIPVREFLSDNGIKNIEVKAVGSSNPLDKANYVLKRIKDDEVDLIRVFEDNARNIREIRKIVKENGETKLQTFRVVDGKIR